MATLGPQSHAFAESFVAEDHVIAAARARAAEIGLHPVGTAAGTMLRLLAAATGARAVVEVGTGTGVSSVWMLRGMRPDGVLTTIDLEPEHQRQARQAFRDGGFPPSKTRLIAGRALDVLPRLADRAYDLVFVDGDRSEYPQYVAEAYRLLRPGGVVVAAGALGNGRVPDPAARDPETVTLRELTKSIRDADEWLPALLPIADGLLTAVKSTDGTP
ncbi:O-methyltransferase [Actinocatenispora rupis]|uniref:Putative O-methyltransferase n=1 Tax=Actinocatenispora rupis TaxID=519421 RepID=A0A8J3JGV1_9ACTN|nr:O-methyltransferase [Actinocatenispora rupis]GID16152.1 putative O-methyltransferase [Actinocatenispora rupis]